VQDKAARRLDGAAESDLLVLGADPLEADRARHLGDRGRQRVVEDQAERALARVVDHQDDRAHEVRVAQLRDGAQQVLREARSAPHRRTVGALGGFCFGLVGHDGDQARTGREDDSGPDGP
jgi:hypothetical protein